MDLESKEPLTVNDEWDRHEQEEHHLAAMWKAVEEVNMQNQIGTMQFRTTKAE